MGDPTKGSLRAAMVPALAVLLALSNVSVVFGEPYVYASPPPPSHSPPPPYYYKSPPPPSSSPPPPYYYRSPPPPSPSPPPPYYYKSPPPPKKSPRPSYYYKSPPPPSPSPPPPYYYKSPPPPVKSPPLPYYYKSPPPPSHVPHTPHYYKSSSPKHQPELVVKVVGHVYCYECYDWRYPHKSHDQKYLEGAVVKVTCKAGYEAIVAYGTTKSNGEYSVTIKGYDYNKYGGAHCEAMLHAPPKGSLCNIPTDHNNGKKGANLQVKSKTYELVVLEAKPFVYAPKECEKPKPRPPSPPPPSPSPPPPYYYKSPPPPVKSPPPPYYYKSPPPPVKSPPPTYYYKSPPPPSPTPAPVYYYKSPPPPSPVPHTPYYYKSPPPPHHRELLVKVVGQVYCYKCYDWGYHTKSLHKKHLKGAVVKITCKADYKEIVAYGTTMSNGKYSVTIKGYDYVKYGGVHCQAVLHAPPKGSLCNVPTDHNNGKKGAKLHVKSKNYELVVLKAKPFAYAPMTPYKECEKPKSPVYYYKSPPPPSHSYYYKSPPPPAPTYYYKSPPPPTKTLPPSYYYNRRRHLPHLHHRHTTTTPYYPVPSYHHKFTVKVTGSVYCYRCYEWGYPIKSHGKKQLSGAVVKVTCKDGYKEIVAYGKTKSNGKYSVIVKGYDYKKYGAAECKAQLFAAPKGSVCNIPTDLNNGKTGALLHVKSKTYDVVILQAKPFAYAPSKPYEQCYKPKPPVYYYKSPPPPTPTYYYKSPPPPTPTYYYKSPPPPSPTYYYKSPPPPTPTYYYKSPPPPSPTYYYKSPPPPPYYYKSPPPPVKSPPPPYYYKSPPPPSPSPPPPYYYKSPPPPSPSPPPPYYYKSPPPPSPSPPPPYYYKSPPPPSPSPPPPYYYKFQRSRNKRRLEKKEFLTMLSCMS
ncbi:hypothetical protein Taro_003456 [Colocasia esculenta]|uniref:Uncharacterized protein n=1 Tax=Colocasia esculenta TaxID=4460 RepID=A0A843TFH5_COLES|nr:hypothetical protein [Colocasia esculenta]